MRDLIGLIEAAIALSDPRFQFHLSVEPNLIPDKTFAEQTRTVSSQGARGDAGETDGGIYTTRNLRYWGTQLAYEFGDDAPAYVYLVEVKDPTGGSVWAAHQEAHTPNDVRVLGLIGEIEPGDDVPDYGRMEWTAEKLLTSLRKTAA